MTISQDIFFSIAELILFLIIIHRLIEEKHTLKRSLLFIISLSILNLIIGHYFNNIVSILLNSIAFITVIRLVFRKTTRESTYIYLICLTLVVITQIISLIPIKFVFGNLDKNYLSGILSLSICMFLVIISMMIIPMKYFHYFIRNRNKMFDHVFRYVVICIASIILVWHIDFKVFLSNFSSVVLLSVLIGLIVVIVLNSGLKNHKLQNEYEANLKYLPIMDELMNDIRMRQHEYNNHLQAIQMIILSEKKLENAQVEVNSYLKECKNFDVDLEEFIKLENKIIAGFLYSKKIKALEFDIDLDIVITGSSLSSHISNYSWIEIIGILLDNAFETCDEHKGVRLKVESSGEGCSVTVGNTYSFIEQKQIELFFKKGFSTKGTNRGYGLSHLKKIVDEHDGEIEFYNEKKPHNYVVFKVVFT